MRGKPRPLFGMMLGLFMAVGLSVIALLIYAVRGPETFDRLGISLGATLALYMLGGLTGGALFGILLPLTRYRWGASVVGVCAALPVYVGAALILHERAIYGIIPAVVVGAAVGYMVWIPPSDTDRGQRA